MCSRSPESFQDVDYLPLAEDEIRVLCLMPGGVDDPLLARLERVEIPIADEVDVDVEEKFLSEDHGQFSIEYHLEDDDESDSALDGKQPEAEGSLLNSPASSDEESENTEFSSTTGRRDTRHYVARRLAGFTSDDVDGVTNPDLLYLPGRPRNKCYEAISYACGNLPKSETLTFCSGCNLPIQPSLAAALRRFRRTDRERRLWADAICINQSDVEERNAQVAKMADIYQTSLRTLVWLGPEEECDAMAFTFMDAIADATDPDVIDGAGPLFEDVEALLRVSPHFHARHEAHGERPNPMATGMRALNQLLKRSWFTRLWVVQETSQMIARDVLFCAGRHWMPRLSFQATFAFVRDHADLFSDGTLVIGDEEWRLINELSGQFGGIAVRSQFLPMVPVRALLRYSTRSCSDPRDRIFAIRSIAHLESISSLTPDYRLDSADLYTRVISTCLTRWRDSDLKGPLNPGLTLALVGTESLTARATMSSRPSWVADLNALSAASREKEKLYSGDHIWRVILLRVGTTFNLQRLSNDNGLHARDSLPQELLRGAFTAIRDYFEVHAEPLHKTCCLVRGRVFARVCEICPVASLPCRTSHESFASTDSRSIADIKLFWTWFRRCLNIIHDYVRRPSQAATIKEALEFLQHPSPWVDSRRHDVPIPITEPYLQVLRREWPPDLSLPDNDSVELVARLILLQDFKPLWHQRRLCLIEVESYTDIAWLPAETQVGDQVCYFAGTVWPFVVRPSADGEFNLIGDGHTYGIPLIEALGGELTAGETERNHWYGAGMPLGLNMRGPSIDVLMGRLGWIRLA